MFKGVSCTSNECLNKAIHWTSIKHVQCIKIYGYLVDIFYERMYAVLAVLGSREAFKIIFSYLFVEAALIIFPSTPIKNTEDGMKRWLRRAKKRRSIDVHWIYLCCLGRYISRGVGVIFLKSKVTVETTLNTPTPRTGQQEFWPVAADFSYI
ncbi:hypothetical protein NQ317_008772 [Molorchus minor]|uniref:Uncharacterized protein n=1 Tax=Molorchus minor TaxID=1323400 RepID=A0ABQ9IUH4_9CUCU|nr:hypothetical protein NQ317_008772 [Molorchus minor]